MDELQRRRLDRLNKEYQTDRDYREPVFSSKRLFWMTFLGFVGVLMVAYGLLD